MSSVSVTICLSLFASLTFAQSDRGTITGTINDPAGAVVANAAVQARHLETGGLYDANSTGTGNYTLAQLPVGSYELTVTVPGFKRYVRRGLDVQVAQTYRIDVGLEVGAASESVTVSEAAPLLKTESGELSHNVTSDRMDSLPGFGIAAGSIRNAYAEVQLVPGAFWNQNVTLRVNGSPGNTQALRVEGQDSSTGLLSNSPSQTQPSVDAIEEVAIQTSNFAAEFGQVGGGLFNVTMKSGTNQFHGSGYDYFANEALNASQPFLNVRPVVRRNDYGVTFGGPLWIPKVYNGREKTFFFFNWEQYREQQLINNISQTVPTPAYRGGDFVTARTGRMLGNDTLGRPMLDGQIYDPLTSRVVNGVTVRDPFTNNRIDPPRLDPVALKAQGFIPQPTNPGLINNYIPVFRVPRITSIPAVKADQFIGPKAKLSGYWSRTGTSSPNATGPAGGDGMPRPISAGRGTFINAHTIRVNFDEPLTPTLLLHLGVGYVHYFYNDNTEEIQFDTLAKLGLKGTYGQGRFPRFAGLLQGGTGGMVPMGTNLQSTHYEERPTANASLAWVRGNHTYKGGAEAFFSGYPSLVLTGANGVFNFTANQTSLPSTIGQNLQGGTLGFPYASFLLGAVDNGDIGLPTDTRLGKHSFALFVQDSWKVTRKFTLDYGLRWDFETYFSEEYGRMPSFSPTVLNPSAGNRPGGIIFEGSLPGRCNCSFGSNYPYALGPRLGAAYQITPKTVFRAGFGVVYSRVSPNNFASQRIGSSNPYASPGLYQPVIYLKDGPPITPVWPVFNPGLYPALPGQLTSPPFAVDQNAGRPGRQFQWSIGLQRELARNLAVEATYVGTRGAWWQANALIAVNAITVQRLAALGLSLNNPADLTLLASPLSSPLAISRGFGGIPYAGFPASATVSQALRPFPQFAAINYNWAPLGRSWYDSLQIKATKRYSHGLDFSYSLAWQKELTMAAETEDTANAQIAPSVNDVFNRPLNKYLSGFSQPLSSILAANYTLPKWGSNRVLSWVVRDWQFGTLLRYASGIPIKAPTATSNLNTYVFQNTFYNRVPGVPVFTEDLNCHCFDPNKEFVLNPAAWTNPPLGQFGTAAAYYSDYRNQRRPSESMSLGRVFRIKEKATFTIRAEFTNIFNRAEVNNPTATSALATQTRSATGQTTGGFGYINNGTTFSSPRSGQMVARFQF